MNAGKLRHRVQIQSPTETQAVNGEITQTWPGTVLATRYGSVEPLSGRELWQAQQVDADVTHRITIRYFAGLTTKMRFVYGGRAFNIESILNTDEQNIELICLCKEEV